MADYAKIQFRRFGLDAESLTDTGLLMADGPGRLRSGDQLIILVSDALGEAIGQRVDRVLKVLGAGSVC